MTSTTHLHRPVGISTRIAESTETATLCLHTSVPERRLHSARPSFRSTRAVSNAPNAAGVLAALTSHQSQISQIASELSTLPKSIKAKATATVDKAQTVITTKNPALIKGNGNGSASYVALYCGQNQ